MKSQQRLHRPRRDDLLLWVKIAEESAIRCRTSTTADIKTVSTRVKHEGFSFLTITLSNFGKDFEESLDQGFVAPSAFCGFHRAGALPRFLGGLLGLVFDRDSGRLLDVPNVDAIKEIRQLTLMYSKIQLPCSNAREKAAYRAYIECEQDIGVKYTGDPSGSNLAEFRRIANVLYKDVWACIDRKLYAHSSVPKHGPGATADRLHANAKYLQKSWPRRLDVHFPMEMYLVPSPDYVEDLAVIDVLEPEAEIPVRVISVPKTLKTPRIIGIEPTAMQYAQQSLLPMILEGIKSFHLDSFLGSDDQTPNQVAAHQGSLYGDLATLDLSEASDRVSNELVINMMSLSGPLRRAVQACRSRKAHVPGYGVQRLAKFASMGSALTFPIEEMVFLTIIFHGIERVLNRRITPGLIKQMRGRVRVYGDDIIVPVEYVPSVIESLELFGAKVNRRKSFWNGKFRESCGKEYYDGQDVSIVKVRQVLPTNRKHVEGVIATVALRNLLYQEGYWSTCQWLDDKIRGILKYFPVVEPSSPLLGRESVLPGARKFQRGRFSPTLHRPEVKGWQVLAKLPLDSLEGSGALLKCFLMNRGLEDMYDDPRLASRLAYLWGSEINEDHLERAGRPRSVDIRLGWGPTW
jgi:hypothetical protein